MAKGEMRLTYTDQRRMITTMLGIVLFMAVVTTVIALPFIPDWIRNGTIDPTWPWIIAAVLAAIRFTVYRKNLVDRNNPFS